MAGCEQHSYYMGRKDTIAFNLGEAVRTNQVTHVADPWPVHAQNKDILYSGNRAAAAARAYECQQPATFGGSGNSSAAASRGGIAISSSTTVVNQASKSAGAC